MAKEKGDIEWITADQLLEEVRINIEKNTNNRVDYPKVVTEKQIKHCNVARKKN